MYPQDIMLAGMHAYGTIAKRAARHRYRGILCRNILDRYPPVYPTVATKVLFQEANTVYTTTGVYLVGHNERTSPGARFQTISIFS
jgi:hypothetical protein